MRWPRRKRERWARASSKRELSSQPSRPCPSRSAPGSRASPCTPPSPSLQMTCRGDCGCCATARAPLSRANASRSCPTGASAISSDARPPRTPRRAPPRTPRAPPPPGSHPAASLPASRPLPRHLRLLAPFGAPRWRRKFAPAAIRRFEISRPLPRSFAPPVIAVQGPRAPRQPRRPAATPSWSTTTAAPRPEPPPAPRPITADLDADAIARFCAPPPRPPGGRFPWAELIARTFPDALDCPTCGGALSVIAYITETAVVRRILQHLGLPAGCPQLAPPACPKELGFDFEPDGPLQHRDPRGAPFGSPRPWPSGIDPRPLTDTPPSRLPLALCDDEKATSVRPHHRHRSRPLRPPSRPTRSAPRASRTATSCSDAPQELDDRPTGPPLPSLDRCPHSETRSIPKPPTAFSHSQDHVTQAPNSASANITLPRWPRSRRVPPGCSSWPV